MSKETSDLAKSLCDVRRAYRLLQGYHRRLCDLLQTIDETLSRGGFTFERWEPMNVWFLPKATKPICRPERWAWDLTPAYQVLCIWGQSKNGKTRRVYLEAVVDTGFEPPAKGEPDPIRFKPAEECTTELWFGTWLARTTVPDWDAAWERVKRLPSPYDGAEKEVTIGTVKYTYRYFGVNVAELVNEGAVRVKLLEPLEQQLTTSQA